MFRILIVNFLILLVLEIASNRLTHKSIAKNIILRIQMISKYAIPPKTQFRKFGPKTMLSLQAWYGENKKKN